MANDPKPLAWQARADMFAQLATMEKAGLPAQQAFGLLNIPPALQTRVKNIRRLLGRGMPIAKAGRQSGLFTELEGSLVGAAIEGGSPAPTYARLADFYATRANQARAVKSRMALPALVLVVGLFTQELPALFVGSVSPGLYLWHAIRPLITIGLLVYAFANLHRLHQGRPTPLRIALDQLLMRMPLFGKMLVRRNIRDFFEHLALLVEAGMPILDALPRALDTIQLSPLKAAFAPIARGIANGATLTDALESIPALAKTSSLALIRTGEGSGTLPEMLFRYAAMESAAIANFDRQVADWLPRIVYALVAGMVAYCILSGPGVGPHLPEELR
ncbi:MAG TPA: type II secretion system F family protein [Burkholderiaceae bacterium]